MTFSNLDNEHQKILATINQWFIENIKGFLPNYGRNTPKQNEYKIIIEKLPEVGVMQNFAQNADIINNQDAEKSLQTGFEDSEEIDDRSLREEKSKEPLTIVQKEAQPDKKMTIPSTTGNLPNEVGVLNKLCQTAFLVQLNFQSARKENIKLRDS